VRDGHLTNGVRAPPLPMRLNRYRFETERPEDADQFLQENNLGFEPVRPVAACARDRRQAP